RPPRPPAELGALDVLGLEGARTAPRITVRPAARTPGNRFYISPADFRRIYGLDAPSVAPLTGAGQRISIPAIGEADGDAVANFRAFFGLPPTTLRDVVAGQDPRLGQGPFRTEATLDAPWAGAVARAASPHVTAVGGTGVQPLRDEAGDAVGYGSERAWNTGSTASGGGRANFFPRPFYQRRGVGRAVPDVAAPADDYPIGVGSRVVCCIGGTSAAAPAWAGVVALLGEARGRPLGLLNPTLYRLGRQQGYGGPRVFHDVVDGTTAVRRGAAVRPGFRAHRGYDLTTGWGSPDVPGLLAALGG